ncbi:MAG: hypothetical protein OEZ20_09110 [candidate division WOR-3 bacterium]|nr:hypothetical protein [candidate division WOR-3 bacterium]MDH5684608.1 hypothetical protein [candidate division WOR-3 bacterium]
MPIIYLKSGGFVECEGYTIRDGCIKAVNVKFIKTDVLEENSKQQEAAIPLNNVLYVLPKK